VPPDEQRRARTRVDLIWFSLTARNNRYLTGKACDRSRCLHRGNREGVRKKRLNAVPSVRQCGREPLWPAGILSSRHSQTQLRCGARGRGRIRHHYDSCRGNSLRNQYRPCRYTSCLLSTTARTTDNQVDACAGQECSKSSDKRFALRGPISSVSSVCSRLRSVAGPGHLMYRLHRRRHVHGIRCVTTRLGVGGLRQNPARPGEQRRRSRTRVGQPARNCLGSQRSKKTEVGQHIAKKPRGLR